MTPNKEVVNKSGPPEIQYAEMDQQNQASELGMWTFLATEILLFGALFTVYMIYRINNPQGFATAAGHLKTYLGGINTAILLLSSFTMALAVSAAKHNNQHLNKLLYLTAFLGLVFLGIKGVEWYLEAQENLVPFFGWEFHFPGPHKDQAKLFFGLYFLMTGLHFLHLLIGVSLAAFTALQSNRKLPSYALVENTGLYWHLVDIVWVFLFPLFYLISGD